MIRLLILAALVTACQTGSKNAFAPGVPFKPAPHIKPPEEFVAPAVTTLTSDGESLEGYFNKDGSSIIYISQNRAEHIHPQIYEMVFATRKERRLSFHDGEDSCAYYMPDGISFTYASTTDEIKEGDELFRIGQAGEGGLTPEKPAEPPSATAEHIKKMKGGLPPFDVYISKINGSKIERITNSPGYDSEVSAHPDGRKLLFTSFRSGDGELYVLDLKSHALKRLTSEKGHDGGAFFSKDGKKIAWRRIAPDMASSQIFVSSDDGKNPRQVTTKNAINWAPSWHPSGSWIVFSSNRDEIDHFELYVVDPKGLCFKRLTYDGVIDTNPSFSPDGTKILFTSNRSGRNQLYLMDFKPPASCAPELP